MSKHLLPHSVHAFVIYVCVTITAWQIRSSIPFFQIPHICINIIIFVGLPSAIVVRYSVVSDSLQHHGLQHPSLPCPSPSPSSPLLKLMSVESVMPFNHLILCHPLLLLPSIFPSIRIFSNALALCIR